VRAEGEPDEAGLVGWADGAFCGATALPGDGAGVGVAGSTPAMTSPTWLASCLVGASGIATGAWLTVLRRLGVHVPAWLVKAFCSLTSPLIRPPIPPVSGRLAC
jgi:hypothetical protein